MCTSEVINMERRVHDTLAVFKALVRYERQIREGERSAYARMKRDELLRDLFHTYRHVIEADVC